MAPRKRYITTDRHAMAPRAERRRENASVAPETPALPADLILEIVALSDPVVLVRCAAACKLLRRDILSPSFMRRVSHWAAPRILVNLSTDDDNPPFSLVHPATPAVASLCHGHLFPFFSRYTDALFKQYVVMTSRGGLVLLRRIYTGNRTNSIMNPHNSERRSDLCVYDPMSGVHTCLSRPPEASSNSMYCRRKYILLTAADGIDCSFQVLVADLDRCSIRVQTASPCGTWWSAKWLLSNHERPLFERYRGPVILHGGVIYWRVYQDKHIIRHDLGRGELGSVELPPTNCKFDQLQLAMSSDGKLLKLLAIEGFMMSVWLQVSVSGAGGSGWSLETVIDMEDELRMLHPDIPPISPDERIEFDGLKRRSGDVVLLQVPGPGCYDTVTVFELKTKDMYTQERVRGSSLLEIDLQSRLQNMKIFS